MIDIINSYIKEAASGDRHFRPPIVPTDDISPPIVPTDDNIIHHRTPSYQYGTHRRYDGPIFTIRHIKNNIRSSDLDPQKKNYLR